VTRLPDPDQPEHALLLVLPLSDSRFGSDADRELVSRLEEELDGRLAEASAGEVDGSETGEGHSTIYSYGPDADVMAAIALRVARDLQLPPGSELVLRRGQPGAASERRGL
jgi:hypothetical protein